jgi:signal transduction histidine kinase
MPVDIWLKFTLSGTIAVRVRSEDGAAVLEISDTGAGIPEEEMARLFERFHRVEGTRTQEGSGIGLALVLELVKLHGGKINVASALGKGTTLRIPLGSAHLPGERVKTARDFAPPTAHAQAYVQEALRWIPEDGSNTSTTLTVFNDLPDSPADMQIPAAMRARIILADDNADMRGYVRDLLASTYCVEAVADGEEALIAARRERPDLVLSDVMMPRRDGFGLLRSLRADGALKTIPVILLSARAGEESRIGGLQEGADDYLVKPFSARELLARVASHLSLAKLRQEAQSAIAASEQRFRVALGASTAGFGILQAMRDADGSIADFEWQFANSSAERLLNHSARDLVGQRASKAAAGSWVSSASFRAVLRNVLETGGARDLEVPTEQGAEAQWFHVSVARLADGVVMWFADITERKRAEGELREADRRKDNFLAVLAHELRNPLAPIRQAALLASTVRATEAQLRWSGGVIDRQVRHMARLLDDLLDVSRITRGRMELRKERLGVKSVIDAAVETARPLVESKRHALRISVPESLPSIEADPMRLAQVISNLLSNAAKYTDPEGLIELTVEVEDDSLLIRVRDNGIGIEPAAIPTLFEMFSQLQPALERSEGGLGIGLALVKGLVKLHGGTVEAHSPGPGMGSVFLVRLPVLVRQALGASERRTRSAPPGAARRRVLVVDDNRDAAETLAALLALEGHEVRAAFDGDDALEKFGEFRPDVAIIDIGLPKKNGYEVARELRGRQGSEDIVLVALTGWGQAEDRVRARSVGFDEHLTKPVDFEVVQRIVNNSGSGAADRPS